MKRKQVKRGVPADGALRERARKLVSEIGDRDAALAMKIGRATLSRLLAELPLAPGTFALVREYFAEADRLIDEGTRRAMDSTP